MTAEFFKVTQDGETCLHSRSYRIGFKTCHRALRLMLILLLVLCCGCLVFF